jgi:hypothetical protein
VRSSQAAPIRANGPDPRRGSTRTHTHKAAWIWWHRVWRASSRLKRCKQAAPASCGGIVVQVSITMRPMRDDEFQRWLPRMRDDYAEDMMRNAGASNEAAREKAAADVDRLFPDGRPSPDQSVFVIEADGEPVGELWATERQEDVHRGALWIFDVRIDEMHRGRRLRQGGDAARRG